MTTQDLNTLFDSFLSQNLGRYVTSLGTGTYQCFDWAVAWTNKLGVPHYPNNPSPFPFANACQIYTDYGSFQAQYFDRIANSATFVPIKGDLCVWAASLNGGAGHVAVATGTGDINTFISSDENWKGGDPVSLITHDYSNFLGVLRYKVSQVQTMDPNIVHKSGCFDRVWHAFKGNQVDTNKVTDQDVTDFITWVQSNVQRAGNWDQECNKAGFPDSSKVSVTDLYSKIQSQVPQQNTNSVYNQALSDATTAIGKLKK